MIDNQIMRHNEEPTRALTQVHTQTTESSKELLLEKPPTISVADGPATKSDHEVLLKDTEQIMDANIPIVVTSSDEDAHVLDHHEHIDSNSSSGEDSYPENQKVIVITPDKLNSPVHPVAVATPSSHGTMSPLDRFPLQSLNHSQGNASSVAPYSHKTVNNSNGDFDYSVVYSGYAGSISAAPSELSCSVDMDASSSVGIEMFPSVQRNNLDFDNNDAEQSLDNDDRHRSAKVRLKRKHRSKRTNRTSNIDDSLFDGFTVNSIITSFTAKKKLLRARRRKMRLAMEKAHQALILSDFRAFLSKNKKKNIEKEQQKKKSTSCSQSGECSGPSKNKYASLRDKEREECRDGGNIVSGDEEAELNADRNHSAAAKNSMQKMSKTKLRNGSSTADFCDVPWIVYQNDHEEDRSISTINGGQGGSFCMGVQEFEHRNMDDVYTQDPDVENGWDKLWLSSKKTKKSPTFCAMLDLHELLYTVLIVCSILTLIVVVIVVAIIYT